MARPKAVIDLKIVEGLATVMCTQEEIATVLGISVRTLLRNEGFCQTYKKGLDKGRASLRRTQFKSAENGNPTMLIWLGKQYLGQKDQIEQSGTTTVNTNVDFSHLSVEQLKKLIDDED